MSTPLFKIEIRRNGGKGPVYLFSIFFIYYLFIYSLIYSAKLKKSNKIIKNSIVNKGICERAE